MVATSLQGNGDIRYYSNNRNDILVVAGGGGGGSDTRAGAGGEVLYDSTGIINGASASLLNGQFGLGSNHRNADGRDEDGGGGGGGYIGGLEGWDGVSGSHGSGGGASFVNTSKYLTTAPMKFSLLSGVLVRNLISKDSVIIGHLHFLYTNAMTMIRSYFYRGF